MPFEHQTKFSPIFRPPFENQTSISSLLRCLIFRSPLYLLCICTTIDGFVNVPQLLMKWLSIWRWELCKWPTWRKCHQDHTSLDCPLSQEAERKRKQEWLWQVLWAHFHSWGHRRRRTILADTHSSRSTGVQCKYRELVATCFFSYNISDYSITTRHW